MDLTDDRRHAGPDHDLLVRIDERLTGHILAAQQDRAVRAADQAVNESRLATLEKWRSEKDGAGQANARVLAILIAASSCTTGVVVWLLQHFVR